jgi:hypothetical protein
LPQSLEHAQSTTQNSCPAAVSGFLGNNPAEVKATMNLNDIVERRHYKRYLVSAEADFAGIPLKVINLGFMGMQARCDHELLFGTIGKVCFAVQGYETRFETTAEVMGSGSGAFSIKFLKKPAHIDYLIRWLGSENYPWIGVELVEWAKPLNKNT